MNLQRIHGSLAFATIVFAGCATIVPVPQLAQPESSGFGIVVTLRAPVVIFSATPDLVYFAKIDNEDGLLQQQIIPSNYDKWNRFYLLNARPGTYVAVGAFFRRISPGVRSTTYTTYFSKDLVDQTRVNVGASDFTFMGSYVVDQSVGLGGADPVQIHYSSVIAPGAIKSGLLHFLSGDFHYRGTALEVKNDEKTRSEFLGNAKEDLAEGGWTTRFK